MNNPKLRFMREDGTDYPEWKNTSLGKIGDVAMCKRILKEQTTENGDVPFFKISTFGGTPDAYISYQLFDDFRQIYRFPQKGAILISAAGTIGKTVRYNGEDAYYQDSNIVWLEHDDSVVDDFLYQFYQQVSWEGLEGSTIKRLYNKNLLETPISLPCLEEQQKIADFLSTVDEVIAQSEAEVQNLEQQKKAAMQKIFLQEVRFKREDGTDYPEWEEKPFVSFCDVITKQTGFDYTKTIKRALLTEQKDGTLPYLQTKNFTGINFDYSTDYYIPIEVANQFERIILDRKCLLFSIVGASVGNIALFPNTVKCFLSGAICVAKPIKEEWAAYLYHFMCSELGQSQIRNATKGSGQATITIEDIRAFSIKTPCLEEQRKIADFLSAYDEAISYAKQELDKWKELKKGLLQQMFV